MPLCRHFECRRRDSNPRHADYDSAALWLYRAKDLGWGTQKGTQPRSCAHVAAMSAVKRAASRQLSVARSALPSCGPGGRRVTPRGPIRGRTRFPTGVGQERSRGIWGSRTRRAGCETYGAQSHDRTWRTAASRASEPSSQYSGPVPSVTSTLAAATPRADTSVAWRSAAASANSSGRLRRTASRAIGTRTDKGEAARLASLSAR